MLLGVVEWGTFVRSGFLVDYRIYIGGFDFQNCFVFVLKLITRVNVLAGHLKYLSGW